MGGQVGALRVIFANGETAYCGFEPWPAFDDEPHDFKGAVVRKLGTLARRNVDLLVRKAPKTLRNRAAYALRQAATAEGIDLARLLVRSEGTLPLLPPATLTTVPIP